MKAWALLRSHSAHDRAAHSADNGAHRPADDCATDGPSNGAGCHASIGLGVRRERKGERRKKNAGNDNLSFHTYISIKIT